MAEKTPAFKEAPLGKSLLDLIGALDSLLEQMNVNFTAQVPVVGAPGAPAFPTAAGMASAAAEAQIALAKTKAAMEKIP